MYSASARRRSREIAPGPRRAGVTGRWDQWSHRQALASLRPARADDRLPSLGRHPLAETVCLCAFAHVGLIGPLHPSTSFLALNRGHGVPIGRGPVTGDWAFDVHATPKPT